MKNREVWAWVISVVATMSNPRAAIDDLNGETISNFTTLDGV